MASGSYGVSAYFQFHSNSKECVKNYFKNPATFFAFCAIRSRNWRAYEHFKITPHKLKCVLANVEFKTLKIHPFRKFRYYSSPNLPKLIVCYKFGGETMEVRQKISSSSLSLSLFGGEGFVNLLVTNLFRRGKETTSLKITFDLPKQSILY